MKKTWIAFLVVDVNGSYAITNPYWVVGEGSGANFDDINADAWYAPLCESTCGRRSHYRLSRQHIPSENNVTRAEFAKNGLQHAPKAEETKDVEFKDVTNDKWYYESVMYMAEKRLYQRLSRWNLLSPMRTSAAQKFAPFFPTFMAI